MFDIGYVLLYRKLLDWEWFGDGNTLKLFLYLLLSANYKQAKWQGIDVNPGQLIITFRSAAEQCNLTMREFRTSFYHLNSTHEITHKTTHHYTLVTIANWASYQIMKEEPTQQTTHEATNQRQTNDKPTTHIEEYIKKERNNTTFVDVVNGYTDDVGLQEAILGWVEMRNKKKKGFTSRALKLALKQLDKLTGNKTELVDHATMKGWESFYQIPENIFGNAQPKPTVKYKEIQT